MQERDFYPEDFTLYVEKCTSVGQSFRQPNANRQHHASDIHKYDMEIDLSVFPVLGNDSRHIYTGISWV